MSPITHFLVSWSIANAFPLNRAEMTAITVAGVAPDLDGAGIIADIATQGTAHPLNLYGQYHHLLGHNALFGLITAGFCVMAANQKWKVFLLAMLTFHIHLLCDVVGSRGPDGDRWPIAYLFPFTRGLQLTWSGQWALNAWPNFAVTIAALALCLWYTWDRGFSPMAMLSKSVDQRFVEALRTRFPRPSDKRT